MSNFPIRYGFVLKAIAGGHPAIVAEAVKLFGTHEGPGSTDNPLILQWAAEVGVADIYKHDATPWCGLGMAIFVSRAGYPILEPPVLNLRALAWERFGVAVDHNAAVLGDLLGFKREGGGHIGLYVAEDPENFHVLGANESDAVSIVPIAKDRLAFVRRPPYRNGLPSGCRKYELGGNGSPVSTNEA